MLREGHTALLNTAGASQLGQMLQKLCTKEGVQLVNIVRKPEQEQILREIGARHVVDSGSATFEQDLLEALAATGATIAFDAIGGGKLAGQILNAMEAAASRSATEYSRYGTSVTKQVYVYGALDPGAIVLERSFGMYWSVGGWLLPAFLKKLDGASIARLSQRVAAELTTTFAVHYTRTVSLKQALDLDSIAAYSRQATGEKYLIDPSLD